MFGVTVASIGALSDKEKQRYQAFYCGLCNSLNTNYGQASRAMLSYELTFLIMLLSSLYEPTETSSSTKCPTHPLKSIPYITTRFSDYAADLTVVFSYHKCLDDQADEGNALSFLQAKLLKNAYEKAASKIPEHVKIIESALASIREMENEQTPPDATSKAFGEMLGFIFENIPDMPPDIFSDILRNFGRYLGQFILLADAAIDLDDDKKSGAYNPFLSMNNDISPKELREMISLPIANAAAEYEKLPLIQDAHILDSIMYQGVWQKFNEKYFGSDDKILKINNNKQQPLDKATDANTSHSKWSKSPKPKINKHRRSKDYIKIG